MFRCSKCFFFPEIFEVELPLKTEEQRSKESSLSDFVSKASFERTDAEITKFVLACGVCFYAIRNPHFQMHFLVEMLVPSQYKVSGPLFDRENQDTNKWREEKLSFGLLCFQNRRWLGEQMQNRMHEHGMHYSAFWSYFNSQSSFTVLNFSQL